MRANVANCTANIMHILKKKWTINKTLCIFTVSQVVDYKVHINESGAQYDETIKVDTEKQTELFKVPAHNNVDQSNILYDFKAVSLSKVIVNF